MMMLDIIYNVQLHYGLFQIAKYEHIWYLIYKLRCMCELFKL